MEYSTANGALKRERYFDNLFASFDQNIQCDFSTDYSLQNVGCDITPMSSKLTQMMSMSFFSDCIFQFLGFDVISLSMASVSLKKICEKSKVIKIKSIDLFELLFCMFTQHTKNWIVHIDQAVVTAEGCYYFGGDDLFLKFHKHRIRFPIDEKYFYFKNYKYNLPKFYCKNKGIKVMKLLRKPFSSIIVSPFISSVYDEQSLLTRNFKLLCEKYREYIQSRASNLVKTYSENIYYDTIDCNVEFF